MPRNVDLTSSSAISGFFQALPVLEAQYTSPNLSNDPAKTSNKGDSAFARALALYLPNPIPDAVDKSLHEFARQCVSPHTLRHAVDAELNPPRLSPWTTFGEENRTDPLWTSEGWRVLKAIGTAGGTVALGYHERSTSTAHRDWNRRIHQFATVYLFSASAALATCPAAMTDGAALLLSRHLGDMDGDQPGRAEVLRAARDRLIQFETRGAWTSGQWMTERAGGSDVSLTETIARRLSEEEKRLDAEAAGSGEDATGMLLGPWRLDGFKWFSSATDSDMVILLAKTEKGISTFYAPMRRKTGTDITILNGVRIVRLKEKLGTKALPTAELEIKGMRAWLIGEEGKGVKEISAVLNSTRLWTGVGAIGGWGRGLAIARAYSKVRKVKDALLQDNIQHVAWMAAEAIKHRAACHLAFLGVALQGLSEQGFAVVKSTHAEAFLPPDVREAETLLRVITPVIKAQCSLASVAGLRVCMESLGGVGYCENNFDGGFMNIARIFRDTNVNCIWEGTTSVMAEDLIRAIKVKGGREALAALDRLISRLLSHCYAEFDSECQGVDALWAEFKREESSADIAQLHYNARSMLARLDNILCTCLLMYDAVISKDRIAFHIATKYASTTVGMPAAQVSGWREAAALDREVFMGSGHSKVERLSVL